MRVLIFRPGTTQNGVLINDINFYEDIRYPVTLNFDNSRIIGGAKLSRGEDGNIYADLELHGADGVTGGWPAMGCSTYKGNWFAEAIGLCSNPNVDEQIPAINIR